MGLSELLERLRELSKTAVVVVEGKGDKRLF
jgi:5S rRNA maturation endonuclease (ribonuclease M5)